MNASRMRIVLSIGLCLLLAGLAFAGWWVQGLLEAQVAKTDHARIDAEVSQLDLDKLRRLEAQLIEQKDVVERAAQIAATADNYQYQDQVVNDLEAYAQRHGITISSFDFATSGAQAGGKSSAPAGTTRTPFGIALVGPLGYDRFMSFLRDIENNLTKLQVASLSLTPTAENPQMISNTSLSLVVYLKK